MEELKRLKELAKWCKEIPPLSSIDWYIERIEYFTKELFEYSKFKVGDKVKLKETPVINEKEAWGWMGYRNTLVKGAIAVIKNVDHYSGNFRYGIIFGEDNGNKGTFTFYEDKLEKVGDVIKECACWVCEAARRDFWIVK